MKMKHYGRKITNLKFKKQLLEKRVKLLERFNYILYDFTFDNFIYNEIQKKDNNYHYEYLCYLYYKEIS